MRENADQNNSKYEHFLRSEILLESQTQVKQWLSYRYCIVNLFTVGNKNSSDT